MKQQTDIQNKFLNQLRTKNILVTVILLNGFQLKGHIKSFDNFTILVDSDGKQQLIYKHAISTFTPHERVNWANEDKED